MSSSPSPSPSLTTKQPHPPRRVPPPCWTHEETLALIESYHEKWYALRRGNLKATHWQEVADSVARRCRFAVPSKTSVQCRHKIEKLRKRYRTEKQRAAATAPNRYSSSWNFFKKMDDMDKGPLSAATVTVTTTATTPTATVDSDELEDLDDDDDDDEDDEDEEDVNGIGIINNSNNNVHPINNSSSPIYHRMISNGSPGSGGTGFRFRIPSGSRPVPSPLGAKPKSNYGRFDESPKYYQPNSTPSPNPNPSPNPRFFNSSSVSRTPVVGTGSGSGSGRGVSGSGSSKGVGSKREMDPVADMVSSIRMLGEGFVKMEQMKIDMAKEMEQMRMEMEMKRTEMILESQQKIVEAFAKGMSGKKKMKRTPEAES